MDINVKRWLWVAGAALGGLVVGFIIFQNFWALITAVIGGLVGGIAAAYLVKGPEVLEDVRKTAESMVGKPAQSQTDLSFVLNNALALNERLRVSEGVSEVILTKAEQALDKVADLAPTLCVDYISDELTFDVCRVATYQLPRLLDPYLALAVPDRGNVETGVIKALDAVIADLTEIDEIFRKSGVEAARHRAKSIEIKFSGIGGATAATA